MDIVTSNYLPGDPRLIDQIVYELKSQGIFDQFRKECIADVDTKPAYQNLSQRVEGSVMNFLKKQRFSEDMNKNQLREQLRKNISESGFLETGVERIVDQVVNPKINTVFLPKVEDVVFRYLGIEKPNQEAKLEEKVDVVNLLPNDLEAISPESVNDHSFNSNSDKKDESIETNENSLNSSNTKTEDESPPFELLEENTKFSVHEENSVDSHLSGISGLASHESNHSTEMKDDNIMDISQDVTQNSVNSDGNLSIVTSEEDTKMEICEEDSNMSMNNEIKEEICDNNDNDTLLENEIKEEKEPVVAETDAKEKTSGRIEAKIEEIKSVQEIKTEDIKFDFEVTKCEDKKTHESRSDSKKSHDKHKFSRGDKDKKDNKDKKSRSKSDSKSKDHKDSKSHSKHSSSSTKDKKDYRNGKDKEEGSEKDKQQVKKEDKAKERDRSKDKSSKSKERPEKDRNRPEKDKVGKDKERSDKEKTYKEKPDKDRSERDKEKSDKDKNRSEKEKSKSDRDKDKIDKSDKDTGDKDRLEKVNKDKLEKDKPEKEKNSSSKHSKDKSSNSSKKDGSSKGKDKTEDKSSRDKSSSTSKDKVSSGSSKHKESNKEKDCSKTTKDKDKLKASSSSKGKEKDKEKKGSGDSKSKSSDKHKKIDKDKSSHHDKVSSPLKKDKDKKAVDDHYSLKDKKSERRSTDRDSNDGSSKMSRNGSFTDSCSQSFKGSSKESSEVFSSGSGDSSNSDKVEDNTADKVGNEADNVAVVSAGVPQAIKYIKPKFASNIHEAMKIMKIRKQLAKMERQNQLSLTQVQVVKESQSDPKVQPAMKELSVVLEKSPLKPTPSNTDSLNNKGELILSTKYKGDNEKQLLPEKQVKIKKSQSIISKDNNENGAIKEEKPNSNMKRLNSKEPVTKEPATKEEIITEETPILKSLDLSMESFEALEARLAQEMSNVNYHMYGEEDDSYEYTPVNFSPVKKRKSSDEMKYPSVKRVYFDTSSSNVNNAEVELVVDRKVKEPTDADEVNAIEIVPVTISDSGANDNEIVDKQIQESTEISFLGNGLNVPVIISDSVTNIRGEEIELVANPTDETIVTGSEGIVPAISDFDINDKKSTEELNAVGEEENIQLTISDIITIVDNKENELVIAIEEFTEPVTTLEGDFDSNTNVYVKDNESVDQISAMSGKNEVIVVTDSPEQTCDVPEKVHITHEEADIISSGDSNIINQNGEELVIDEVQEACEDYIQETLISDNVGDDYDVEIVKNKQGLDMECTKEIIIEHLNEPDDVEINTLQLESDRGEDLEKNDVNTKLNDDDDNFRGFDDTDRNIANVIKFNREISDIERNILEKLNNTDKLHFARIDIPELTKIKTSSPRKDQVILKHGMSFEATIKEVTNMSSTIQDLLQKNGKKLFIKIDKLEYKLPSKVLVSLQGMETNGIVSSPVCEVNDVSYEEMATNRQELMKENVEARENKLLECNGDGSNQNGVIFKKPLNVCKDVLPAKSNKNGLKENKVGKWEDDNSPCYYFDKSNSNNDEHLKVLNNMIGKLEKAVEKQSLQIQNNIPAVKKSGRKRKAQSTENNNSISAEYKLESKRKRLSDATPHQNGENLCNANMSQDQRFSLPLSPTDSEKSDEHKKEEPVTVKTKRTGRISNTKRYSSEDLYKPRPVLKYGSSRRRSAKQEHKP